LIISDEVTYIGVLMGMQELGIHYPQDIKLVVQGTKGEDYKCAYLPPRLMFNPEQVATCTVDTLLHMIRENIQSLSTVRFAPLLEENNAGSKNSDEKAPAVRLKDEQPDPNKSLCHSL